MMLVASLTVLLALLSIGGASFMWTLHREVRSGLSRMLAITSTFAAVAACAIGALGALVLLQQGNTVRSLWPLLIAALLVLDAIPIINAAFLRFLQGREP